MSSKNGRAVRPRGRPRSAEARGAVLKAAREILEESGLPAVTIEAVAVRSGISRPTIYRSWPNRYALAMAAFLETAPLMEPQRATVSALNGLASHLRQVASVFATRTGRSIAAMVAAAQSETEISKAFRSHFILKSREQGKQLLELAIEQGELRADIDVSLTLDLLYAPLYFRLLIGHGPLTPTFTDGVLAHLLAGLRPGGKRTTPNAKRSGPGPLL